MSSRKKIIKADCFLWQILLKKNLLRKTYTKKILKIKIYLIIVNNKQIKVLKKLHFF